MRRAALRRVAMGLSALLLAACGGGDGGETSSSTPTKTASSVARAPARTVTQPPPAETPKTTPTLPAPPAATTRTSPEQPPGGGGDEGGNRIPVRFRLGAGGAVRPPVVRVPAFFRLAVRIVNRDTRTHRVVLTGPGRRDEYENLPAGGVVSFAVAPSKKAVYRVLVDRRVRGRIVTGAQPGP